MTTPTPVQWATVKLEDLRREQWEIALLLLTAGSRTLTLPEIDVEVHKLSDVIESAKISWTTE